MKTLYRCVENDHYSLQSDKCPKCGAKTEYPYPARFSLVKEKKYRHLIRKSHHDLSE